MKKNMSLFDRILRILIALTAVFLYYDKLVTGTAGIILLIVAGLILLTAVVGTCPLYYLFGTSTCQRKHAS
jgi:hypothetical protein